MKKIIVFPLALLLLFASCGNRKEKESGSFSDDQMDELFAIEKENQNRAKYGEKVKIRVIADPGEVAKIRAEIELKLERKRTEDGNKVKKPSPGLQYKKGDKTVVPRILDVLKTGTEEERRSIYDDIEKNYDDPDDYSISEPTLIAAIVKNIDRKEDEKDVVQLMGYMKLNGYVKVFEDRLLSGKSADVGRLVYWLGQDGKSIKTFEFIEKQLKQKDLVIEEDSWIMDGLQGFADHGDAKMKARVFETCIDMYNTNRIEKHYFDEIKNSYSLSNPAVQLLNILFDCGDKRVIPIAEKYLDTKIWNHEALAALLRLEGNKYKPQLIAMLKKEDQFADAVEAALILYTTHPDKEIPEELLRQYEKHTDHPSYQTENVVDALIKMKATTCLEDPSKVVGNAQLVKDIKKAYVAAKSTPEDIAKDLFEMGVIDKPLKPELIQKAKARIDTGKDGDSGNDNGLMELLDLCDIYDWFDAETGFVPVGYDELIQELLNKSNGKLNKVLVGMDATGGLAEGGSIEDMAENVIEDGKVVSNSKEENKISYKISLVANDRVYIAEPGDIGDWYDVNAVLGLLNRMLEDSGLKERYVFLDTGDQTAQIMFGPEDKVKAFAAKYGLEHN